MSFKAIQLGRSAAISSSTSCLSRTRTRADTHSFAPNLSPHSTEHTLIHLQLTNLTAICSQLTNSQLSSFDHRCVISPLVHQFTTPRGTEPPPCIMHALADLIETENVMFHFDAPLTGRPLGNQACEAITKRRRGSG